MTRTRYDGELAAKVRESHFGDVQIVNGDATFCCLHEAEERECKGALSGTRAA